MFGIGQDVTDKKKAEEALKESEERFKKFVDKSLEGIWQIDAQGITTYASPRMGEILGYSVNEVVGKNFMDFMD